MRTHIAKTRRRAVVCGLALAAFLTPGLSASAGVPVPPAFPAINPKFPTSGDPSLVKVDALLLQALDPTLAPQLSGSATNRSKTSGTAEIALDLTVRLGKGTAARLRAAGLQIDGAYPQWNRVSGRAALEDIPAIAELPEVVVIHREHGAVTNVGSVVNQADASMNADVARAATGFDGTGTTIGILSDTLNSRLRGTVSGSGCSRAVTGMDNQVSGDLPPSILLLDEPRNGSDEGAGMAELIADVAPGADLAFASAFVDGQAGFASHITALKDCGADVIVDDVIYLAEPMFQDGPIAQAAQAAVDSGVAYFSAAGNQGTTGADEFYDPLDIGGKEVHAFGGDGLAELTVPSGTSTTFVMQWNEPFDDGLLRGATIDYDLYVYADRGRTQLLTVGGGSQGCSTTPALLDGTIGGDPLEIADHRNNTGAPQTLYIEVERFCGTPSTGAGDRFRIATYTSEDAVGEVGVFDKAQQYGHAVADGVVSVAAIDFCEIDTDGGLGGSPTVYDVEGFSSLGGDIPIYFDAEGDPLPGGPITRAKPELTAPDGSNTSFFGGRRTTSGCDTDSNPNFFGTSAAAPHAAAVAALMLQKNPTLTPAEVTSTLMSTAVDAETLGYDFLSGAGFIDAAAAVAATSVPTQPTVSITRADGQPDPTNALPVTFTATFSQPVDGLTPGDVIIAGTAGATSATSVTGAGTTYDIVVSGATGSGSITARIPGAATTATSTGEENAASNTTTVVYDVDAPVATVDVAAGQDTLTNTTPVRFTITFDEPITGFTIDDLTITGTGGAIAAGLTGGGANYTATVTDVPNDGTVTLDVDPGAVTDNAGNPSTTSVIVNMVTVDRTGPTATIDLAAGQDAVTNTVPVRYTITFAEPVTGFTADDLAITGTAGATTASLTGGPSTYTATISSVPSDGTVTLDVTASDEAGNPATVVAVADTVTVDRTGPVATIDLAPSQQSNAAEGPVEFSINFDEPVTGFSAADLTVSGTAGARLATVSGGPTGYTASVGTVPNDGTVIVSVVAGAVVDSLENPSTSAIVANTVTVLAASGPKAAPVFVSISPVRLVETRVGDTFQTIDDQYEGDGTVKAGATYRVKIAGRGTIPATARAAVLNLTTVAPRAAGFVTIFPCGTQPKASGINFTAGAVANNEIIAKLSAAGEICIFASAETHVVIDAVGSAPATSPYVPVEPARIVETRVGGKFQTVDDDYEGDGTIKTGTTYQVKIAGRGGIDPDAAAAVLNLTTVAPVTAGFLTVFPCGTQPKASVINYTAGAVVNNEIITKLSATGEICIFASAETHVVIDAAGYIPAGTAYTPIDPARVVETRSGAKFQTVDDQYEGDGTIKTGTTYRVKVAGRGGVDASAIAATLNLTTVAPITAGFLTIFPCGTQPKASGINYTAGAVVNNEIIAKLSPTGDICIFASAETHLVIDATGWL